ncbi:MAG: LysR family transcriptional regulator [Sphingobium sp.]
MKLHQLRALAEVARAGSIQRAARAMHVSQPALSKALRELERELGVSLLTRGVAGTTLTPFGAILSKRHDAIQKELDKAREEVDWLKGTLGGRLLVGISPPVAGTSIASVVGTFRKRQPSVEMGLLELRPAQIFDAIRGGTLDLGIVHHYGSMDLAGLQCVTLKTYGTMLAIGGRDPALPQTVDQLWSLEWITGDLSDYHHGYIPILADRIGRNVPQRISRCTSISVYFELAEQPGLISHWAEIINSYLDLKLRSGALTRIDLGIDLPDMHIALVYKDEELLTPGGALLAKIIRSSLR